MFCLAAPASLDETSGGGMSAALMVAVVVGLILPHEVAGVAQPDASRIGRGCEGAPRCLCDGVLV